VLESGNADALWRPVDPVEKPVERELETALDLVGA